MANNLSLNLKNYTFDFTDEQVKQFRSNISDLYKLLKDVFDRPRRQPLIYNSYIDYKVKRQRIYQHPDTFYNFTFDNINVHVARRVRSVYSVAVHGVKVSDKLFKLLGNPDSYISSSERDFSCGFIYYGRFPLSQFQKVVEAYNKIVACIVFDYFSLDSSMLYKQLEFIW